MIPKICIYEEIFGQCDRKPWKYYFIDDLIEGLCINHAKQHNQIKLFTKEEIITAQIIES